MYDNTVKEGKFNDRNKLPKTVEIWDKNILIAGFGRIGQALIKRCLGFEMKVFVYDPFVSKDVIEKLSRIETDTLKHFENFLFELDQIKEGDRTLLDNTTVVMGSNFGDSSNHTCNNLPMIVAGGGYQHENHKVMQEPTPLCNLYLELLHKHNVDVGNFGSSEKSMNLLKV